jgi:hypothetical protein
MTPALKELSEYDQWVCWKLVDKKPKPKKVPMTPFGVPVSSNEAAASKWTTYEVCQREVDHPKYLHTHKGLTGVGFVFSSDDPYVGIDLDGCRDPETGKIEKWAGDVIKMMDTYTEISPSGTGVHMICRGNHLEVGHNKKPVEMYTHRRFFTWTGKHLEGTPDCINDRADQADGVEMQYCLKGGQPRSVVEDMGDLDFRISHDASLPRDKFDAVMANNADFKDAWEHKGKDADTSMSQFDMALATQCVKMKWQPHEVAATIISHRAKYCDGKDFEKALRPDYIRRTYNAAVEFVSRGVDGDTASIQDAMNTGGDEAVSELGRLLGIPVTEIIKRPGSPNAIYYLVYLEQEVRLGTMRDMLNQDAMRAAVGEATHRIFEPKKKKEWGHLIQLLCSVSRFEEVEGAGKDAELVELVNEYYENKGVGDDMENALAGSFPFIKDGELHLHVSAFRRFLLFHADMKLKPSELRLRLREAGFKSRKINFRKTSKGYWYAPDKDIRQGRESEESGDRGGSWEDALGELQSEG